MQAFQQYVSCPHLRELVVEATLALARLDAERLEELALSCRALPRLRRSRGEPPVQSRR